MIRVGQAGLGALALPGLLQAQKAANFQRAEKMIRKAAAKGR